MLAIKMQYRYSNTRYYQKLLLKSIDFEINHFFDGIYGSSPQAVHKADVIRQALATHNLDPENVVLIGDTKFDMIGAQETGIKKLAVTWGFSDEKDLMAYQPDWVAHQPADILRQL